jgi:hypothetical protein
MFPFLIGYFVASRGKKHRRSIAAARLLNTVYRQKSHSENEEVCLANIK